MGTKMIKVEESVHSKAKEQARSAGMTLAGYVKKLVEKGLQMTDRDVLELDVMECANG